MAFPGIYLQSRELENTASTSQHLCACAYVWAYVIDSDCCNISFKRLSSGYCKNVPSPKAKLRVIFVKHFQISERSLSKWTVLFFTSWESVIMTCGFELFNFVLIIPLYAQSFGVGLRAQTPQGVTITDAIIHLVPTRISVKGMWFESMVPRILEKHLLPL